MYSAQNVLTYSLRNMQKANFWFPFRCAVPGKEERYQIFLPPVPVCGCLCRGALPITMATGGETQFDSPLRTLLIKLPRGFGFQQPRQQHQGSSWNQSCPGTPEPDGSSTVLLSSTPLVLWKWLKVIKNILAAHLKKRPSLLPRQQQQMERVGQGEPGSQQVCGRNSCWDSWADCEEAAPHSAQMNRCWGIDFKAPLHHFSPHFQTQILIAIFSTTFLLLSRSSTIGHRATIILPMKQWGYLPATSSASLSNTIFSLDISPFLSDPGPGGR